VAASTEKKWPAEAVVMLAVASLVPYARNARTHSKEQVDQLAASIREWGWTVPILVDEENSIIAGHGRVLAAKKLGIAEVPAMVARGWTEAQRRAYVLADNKLAENAGWDKELLKVELKDLDLQSFNLELTGFSLGELGKLLDETKEGLTDPNAVPEAPAQPVSEPGDVWELGNHRIICGDSTAADIVAKLLGPIKPHLMVTDPPYGVNYDPEWRAKAGVNKNEGKLGKVLNDDRADWREAWALFPGEVAYVWHAGLFSREVQDSLEACGFQIRSQIIWAKERFALSRGHYHWQHEPCWYAVKGTGHWHGDRSQSTLWEINSRDDAGVGHGTQKPVECMLRPITNNSSPGQAIYEPFSGSGTTIIAGEQSGRHVYAVELNPAYVDVAVTRWAAFTGKTPILLETGETYTEVQARRRPDTTARVTVVEKKPAKTAGSKAKGGKGGKAGPTPSEESEALR
jgi:DNA modification methylase